VSRRFYFLTWEPELWTSITLVGENTDVDLALKTVMRLLARNSSKHSTQTLNLNGCARLTDRGLAIIARTCPQLIRLEVQGCINITNGGLMDLVSKCHRIDHLDISGEKKTS
jgi:F-box/leucine-rich repeat protein 7